MISMIFQVILDPLEKFLHIILESAFTLTHSYGLSIIVLSVVVNLILLPMYILAEKLQEKEIEKQNLMKDKMQEITQCFSGQERFQMRQTLYRIHHYHPIMGLRSIGSLLIQIPFFFAAYHFLKSYEALENVSFLFISNLQVADALIPLGRYAINILPFIMTFVNIVSAQWYTLRKNPNALLSTWGMAAIFLVLLYTSPAGLVLYWTCNNIFSLLKNIILQSLSKKKTIADSKNYSTTTRTILKEKFEYFASQEKKIIQTILFLWAITLYFLFSYVLIPNNRTRGLVPNTLLNISTLILGVSALLLCALRIVLHKKILATPTSTHSLNPTNTNFLFSHAFHIFTTVLGLIILIYYIYIPIYEVNLNAVKIKLVSLVLIALPNILYLNFFIRLVSNYNRSKSNNVLKKNPLSLYSKPLANIRSTPTIKSPLKNYCVPQHISQLYIFILASFLLIFLIFFALPADIYKSEPLAIGMSFITIATVNAINFIIIFLSLIVVYLVCPPSIKLYVQYFVVSLAFILFSYALIIPFDIGNIDNFALIFPQRIVPNLGQYILEGIGLVCTLFLIFSFLPHKPFPIIGTLIICNAILIGYIISPSLWIPLPENQSSNISQSNTNPQAVSIPNNAQDLLTFSKQEKNIVVILLDMVNGGYVQRALEDNPSLATKYNGFTWYPNTLSISTFTTPSKPSLMAGWQYTPENIAKVNGKNLAEKVIKSYDVMLNTFITHNYHIAITGMSYYGADSAQCSALEERGIACLNYWDNSYIGYWTAHNSSASQTIANTDLSFQRKIQLLNSTGLLRAVPLAFKQKIYDQGNWNLLISEFKNQEGYNFAIKHWAFLDSLDSLSSIEQEENILANNKGTFKFIHSNITHRPYALDTLCNLRNDVYPDEIAGNDYEGDASYFTFRCSLESLARWIDWLKINDIYDNTKIILFSDHGNDFAEDPMNTHNISPQMMGLENPLVFSRSHVLLMIKDFNQNEKFNTDYRMMSNTDVASIMYHSIDNYVAPPNSLEQDTHDPTKITPPSSRTLPIYHTEFYNWVDLVKEKKGFSIINKYLVHDNIFEPDNWEKIQ